MGGILATALSSLRPDLINGLALLATPWDFSVPEFPLSSWDKGQIELFVRYIADYDELPAHVIHTFFHCIDPYSFQNCVRKFASASPADALREQFLAIQYWANDGVPLTKNVAQECFSKWIGDNILARRQWQINTKIIDPRQLQMPCFFAVPQKDKIVPAQSALPLKDACVYSTTIYPKSGHVGMIVGSQRKKQLWHPLLHWIYTCGTRPLV